MSRSSSWSSTNAGLPCSTRPTANSERSVESSGHVAYSAQAHAVATGLRSESTTNRSSPPEVIAKAVTKAASARRPETRHAVGAGAKPLIFLRRRLPDRAYDAMIRRVIGLR